MFVMYSIHAHDGFNEVTFMKSKLTTSNYGGYLPSLGRNFHILEEATLRLFRKLSKKPN